MLSCLKWFQSTRQIEKILVLPSPGSVIAHKITAKLKVTPIEWNALAYMLMFTSPASRGHWTKDVHGRVAMKKNITASLQFSKKATVKMFCGWMKLVTETENSTPLPSTRLCLENIVFLDLWVHWAFLVLIILWTLTHNFDISDSICDCCPVFVSCLWPCLYANVCLFIWTIFWIMSITCVHCPWTVCESSVYE